MTDAQAKRVAPNINLFLWRPILSNPPIYSQHDLNTWVTLDDVLDAHEALNLVGATNEHASRQERRD